MTPAPIAILCFVALAACGGGGGGPIEVPAVPAGEYEADCQSLCTLGAGETICNAEHQAFCVAKCRARTNGLPQTCADCLIAAGSPIAGFTTGEEDDSYCSVGGPADMTACEAECDDAGVTPSTPEIAVLCDLECGFYVQSEDPLACSADGSAECRAECDAALAANGRICSQCLIDQTLPTRFCFDDDCDCEPQFDDDTSFGCAMLCDAT